MIYFLRTYIVLMTMKTKMLECALCRSMKGISWRKKWYFPYPPETTTFTN
jgi:hypothetical protein